MKTKQKARQETKAKEEQSRARPQEMIYGADKKIQSAHARAGEDKINGKGISQLYESLTGERLAVLTRLAAVERLLMVSRILNKPLKDLTEKDWNKLVVRLEQEEYKDWTIHGFAKSLRKMENWELIKNGICSVWRVNVMSS